MTNSPGPLLNFQTRLRRWFCLVFSTDRRQHSTIYTVGERAFPIATARILSKVPSREGTYLSYLHRNLLTYFGTSLLH